MQTISKMVAESKSNLHKLLVEEKHLFNDLEMVSKRGSDTKSSIHKLFGGESKGKLHKLSIDEEDLFNHTGIKSTMVSQWFLDKLFAEAEALINSLEIISKTVGKSRSNLYKFLNNFVENEVLYLMHLVPKRRFKRLEILALLFAKRFCRRSICIVNMNMCQQFLTGLHRAYVAAGTK